MFFSEQTTINYDYLIPPPSYYPSKLSVSCVTGYMKCSLKTLHFSFLYNFFIVHRALEHSFTLMKNIMRENGMQIRGQDGVACIMQMAPSMKGSGTMTREVVKECSDYVCV